MRPPPWVGAAAICGLPRQVALGGVSRPALLLLAPAPRPFEGAGTRARCRHITSYYQGSPHKTREPAWGARSEKIPGLLLLYRSSVRLARGTRGPSRAAQALGEPQSPDWGSKSPVRSGDRRGVSEMPGRKARRNAPLNPTRAELPPEFAAQLRKIGDKVYCTWSAPDITAVLAQMPGKKSRKSTMRRSPSPTRVPADLKDECDQLRRIGDKVNLRQKLLNFISKLFNLIT